MKRAYYTVSLSVAGLLIAVAVYLGPDSYQTAPIASPQPATLSVFVSPDPSELRALRNAPDRLATLKPEEACPISAFFRPTDPDFPPGPTVGGSGPLWLQGIQYPQSAITVQHVAWVSHDRSGFFLVRGRQLDGPGLVYFSAGASADPASRDLVLPLQIRTDAARWVMWEATYRVDRSGCYGLSVTSSSALPETIVFRAL
jgi:hypothetical protein